MFNEFWTSLWILGAVIFTIEKIIDLWRNKLNKSQKLNQKIKYLIFFYLLSIVMAIYFLKLLDFNILNQINWNPIPLPTLIELNKAANDLPLFDLSLSTLTR